MHQMRSRKIGDPKVNYSLFQIGQQVDGELVGDDVPDNSLQLTVIIIVGRTIPAH